MPSTSNSVKPVEDATGSAAGCDGNVLDTVLPDFLIDSFDFIKLLFRNLHTLKTMPFPSILLKLLETGMMRALIFPIVADL
jgi:hypothetical protein